MIANTAKPQTSPPFLHSESQGLNDITATFCMVCTNLRQRHVSIVLAIIQSLRLKV